MLLALLILIGSVVFCLLIAWLGMRVFFPPLKSVPVRIEQVGGGMESGVVGESMQLDSPTPQDIAAESDLSEPELQETLQTVIDVGALNQVDIADPSISDEETTKRGGGQQTGTGNRPGYGFGPGKPGIPPHMRWEISFGDGNTLDIYARELDFFGIELGVYTTGRVTYAKKLARPKPEVYTGPSSADKRLYMSWRQGKLKEADRELMGRAGVAAAGKVVLQFYPDAAGGQKRVRTILVRKGSERFWSEKGQNDFKIVLTLFSDLARVPLINGTYPLFRVLVPGASLQPARVWLNDAPPRPASQPVDTARRARFP